MKLYLTDRILSLISHTPDLTDIIPISSIQLILSFLFVIIATLIVIFLKIGLSGKVLIASFRCYAQLFISGYLLYYIFSHDNPLITIIILLVMIGFSVQNIISLIENKPAGIILPVIASQGLTGVFISFLITLCIIDVEPWYRAQYVVPIAGMVFGNSMSSITLAAERVFSDVIRRKDEVQMLVALGASPWEASLPSIREAVKAGLLPLINRTATVGIVWIPGMMTGQVLAGAPPIEAAKYQIVIMLMLLAAGSLGAFTVILWSYKKAFDKIGNLL